MFLKNWNPLELAVEGDDDDIPLQLGGRGDRRDLYGDEGEGESNSNNRSSRNRRVDGGTEGRQKKAFDELGNDN